MSTKPRIDWRQPQQLMILSQRGEYLAVQHLVPDIAEVPYATCAMMLSLGKPPATCYHVQLGNKDKKLELGSIVTAQFRQSLSESLKAKAPPVIDLV